MRYKKKIYDYENVAGVVTRNNEYDEMFVPM